MVVIHPCHLPETEPSVSERVSTCSRAEDEDEQVLRHRGKPRHLRARFVPQRRVVTTDFAETGDAEEDAPQHLHDPKYGIHGCLRESGCSCEFSLLAGLSFQGDDEWGRKSVTVLWRKGHRP